MFSFSGISTVLQPKSLHFLVQADLYWAGTEHCRPGDPCTLLCARTLEPPLTHLVPLQQPPHPHRLVQTHLPVVVAAWCRQVPGSPASQAGLRRRWRALQLQQPHSLPPPRGAGRTGCSAPGRGLQARLSRLRQAGRHLQAKQALRRLTTVAIVVSQMLAVLCPAG